jgi:hypothetical protein
MKCQYAICQHIYYNNLWRARENCEEWPGESPVMCNLWRSADIYKWYSRNCQQAVSGCVALWDSMHSMGSMVLVVCYDSLWFQGLAMDVKQVLLMHQRSQELWVAHRCWLIEEQAVNTCSRHQSCRCSYSKTPARAMGTRNILKGESWWRVQRDPAGPAINFHPSKSNSSGSLSLFLLFIWSSSSSFSR